MSTVSKWQEVKDHTFPQIVTIIVAAFLVSTLLSVAFDTHRRTLVYLLPSSLVMSGVDTFVPNHSVGSNPVIEFNRVPMTNLSGGIVIDVRLISDHLNQELCSVSRSDILFQDVPGENTWRAPLSVWLKGCTAVPLQPGTYRADIQPWVTLWGETKRLQLHSEYWTVEDTGTSDET